MFPPSAYRNQNDPRLVEARNPYTDVIRSTQLIEEVKREDIKADAEWKLREQTKRNLKSELPFEPKEKK
jgi:hypothetical protein